MILIGLFVLLFILYICISKNISKKSLETWIPLPYYYSSPPKRNMPYDLRCIPPPIPRRLRVPWNNSPYDYYYRPKCLMPM